MTHLLELLVPRLDDVHDSGVGVQDDKHGHVEGARGRVDDVADVLVVPALRVLRPVSPRLGPGGKTETEIMKLALRPREADEGNYANVL